MCRLFGFRSVIQSQVHRSLVAAENCLAVQSEAHRDGWGVAWYLARAPHLIKGTSAALYMAELKGLILSLSQIYQSPKRLLLELNRILSANLLDNRTFITMIYAVLDLEARTVTYVRAGHTPLIYVPADGPAPGPSQVLTPDGLVVGLHLEGIEEKFAELLEEQTLPIGEGDLFAFYTDGITEAMNEESDLFGEERLSRLLEEHAHLPSDEIQAQILGDVEAFVGGAEQHDDMTIVLLRIDDLPE